MRGRYSISAIFTIFWIFLGRVGRDSEFPTGGPLGTYPSCGLGYTTAGPMCRPMHRYSQQLTADIVRNYMITHTYCIAPILDIIQVIRACNAINGLRVRRSLV